MIKILAKVECEIKDKVYQLYCDQDSPIVDVREALFQFNKIICQIEDNVKVSQQKQENPVEKKEE